MRRLEDTGPDVAARELIASLRLRDGAPIASPAGPRPRVAACMIASVDGRATIAGRSGGLGHPEDRALLRGLRAAADAVLAGTQTLIAERYANLLDGDQRAERSAAGLEPHPVLATVSRQLGLRAGDVPIFGEPDVRIAIYSETGGDVGEAAADVAVHPLGAGGLAFPRVLAHLHREYGVRAVACEGGPRLLRELVAQGCLDDLLLTVSPRLVAGDGPTSLAGPELPGAPRLRLQGLHRADDHLFLHYTPEEAARP